MTLKERIIRNKDGKLIFSDYFDEYKDGYVRNTLMELVQEGGLIRLSKGIYYKPVRTRLGILYPQVDEVINAIAKRDHAVILPTGNTAVHQLGLTTQVPMNYEYLTNGAARQLIIDKRTVRLKHGVAANFAFRGKLMSMLHQAMRAIGKNNITKEHIAHIAHLIINHPEQDTWQHDMKILAAWELNIIKPVINRYHEQMD